MKNLKKNYEKCNFQGTNPETEKNILKVKIFQKNTKSLIC